MPFYGKEGPLGVAVEDSRSLEGQLGGRPDLSIHSLR